MSESNFRNVYDIIIVQKNLHNNYLSPDNAVENRQQPLREGFQRYRSGEEREKVSI